ncbi:MAG TPA: hypothetical protein VKB35_04785 [Ktedonobacteraceae bacterium]|nr:hypothetical protein [Ktedonobacteraceae bacterium]
MEYRNPGQLHNGRNARKIGSPPKNNRANTKLRLPPVGHRRTVSPLLLGLLSLFEVAFDLLSLVAALLGGFTVTASNTPDTITTANTTANGSTEESAQVAHISQTTQKRPVGVTSIAILLGILGIVEGSFGGVILVASLLGAFVLPLHSAAVGGAAGVFYLLVGLVKLFFTWGLWRLQRWAFWATVCIAAVSLLMSVIHAMTEPVPTSWVFLVDIVIPTAILIYFSLDSNVRTAFRV